MYTCIHTLSRGIGMGMFFCLVSNILEIKTGTIAQSSSLITLDSLTILVLHSFWVFVCLWIRLYLKRFIRLKFEPEYHLVFIISLPLKLLRDQKKENFKKRKKKEKERFTLTLMKLKPQISSLAWAPSRVLGGEPKICSLGHFKIRYFNHSLTKITISFLSFST